MVQRVGYSWRVAFLIAAWVGCAAVAGLAQTRPTAKTSTTAPAAFTPGPLRIHVTAVQGGAQYRLPGQNKWQILTVGINLAEGVEFRTGPQGAIQFTVGTDEVYRIDRLTAARILRASLRPDGTIQTDLGMTYGRVSKDVDAPVRPHQDEIVTPNSTLAVRGTRVSIYDQPPYTPQAISLTGAAIYRNIRGELVQLGSKGGGLAFISGNATNVPQQQIENTSVDPNGGFAGRTGPEAQQLATALSRLPVGGPGVFGPLVRGTATPATTILGTLPMVGILEFPMYWTGSPFSVVDFSVTSPLGETVSYAKPTAPSGGVYVTSAGGPVANQSGLGEQDINWGTITGTFPAGTYKITETLKGTSTQTLAQNPQTAVTTYTYAIQATSTGSAIENPVQTQTLNAGNPTVTYNVKTPLTGGTSTLAVKKR
jgi:hypothetical protein